MIISIKIINCMIFVVKTRLFTGILRTQFSLIWLISCFRELNMSKEYPINYDSKIFRVDKKKFYTNQESKGYARETEHMQIIKRYVWQHVQDTT